MTVNLTITIADDLTISYSHHSPEFPEDGDVTQDGTVTFVNNYDDEVKIKCTGDTQFFEDDPVEVDEETTVTPTMLSPAPAPGKNFDFSVIVEDDHRYGDTHNGIIHMD